MGSRCQLLHLANKYFIPVACFGLRRRMLLIGSPDKWFSLRLSHDPLRSSVPAHSWPLLNVGLCHGAVSPSFSTSVLWNHPLRALIRQHHSPSFILIVPPPLVFLRLSLPVPLFTCVSLSVLPLIVLTCVPLHSSARVSSFFVFL